MPIFKKVHTDFFKTWTHDMAYVLGCFAADGNIIKTKRGTHFISLSSADFEILISIGEVLGSDHKISERQSVIGSEYRIQISSKEIYSDLLKLGFSENKSNRMRMPVVPQSYIPDFLRGYFDGDGNVWVGYMNKKRANPNLVLQVAFTSGSQGFLNDLWNVTKKQGIVGGTLYTSKKRRFSRLSISTNDALKLSEIMYNRQPKLYLNRKRLRFEQFRS
jgi:intein-encoded DNA endonuclease-like protein